MTRVGDPGAIYPASRGTRTGGDGFQGSHRRSESRLTPRAPVGVMDPAATTAVTCSGNQNRYVTRPDVEALDMMGWNVHPPMVSLAVAESVTPVLPSQEAVIPSGEALTFAWDAIGGETWTLFIYQGSEVLDDNPMRVYEDLTSQTLTIPIEEALPVGQYVWYVLARTLAGDTGSTHRTFEVVRACPADFNGDGNVDPDDLAGFIACYFSLPPCPEGDFNHDGNVDPDDLADYVAAHFEGC